MEPLEPIMLRERAFNAPAAIKPVGSLGPRPDALRLTVATGANRRRPMPKLVPRDRVLSA